MPVRGAASARHGVQPRAGAAELRLGGVAAGHQRADGDELQGGALEAAVAYCAAHGHPPPAGAV